MKSNTRFIKSVLAEAAKEQPALPWARGARRAAFVAKRKSEAAERKTA
jgi:hypothetical protein